MCPERNCQEIMAVFLSQSMQDGEIGMPTCATRHQSFGEGQPKVNFQVDRYDRITEEFA